MKEPEMAENERNDNHITLTDLLNGIHGADTSARDAARGHWDSLAKPLGSLGTLEQAVTKIAAVTGKSQVNLDRASLLVFCADNGVTAQGVSQSDSSVTTAVAKALGQNTSTVSYMAAQAGCRVAPVNVGMEDPEYLPGVLQHCIRRGTRDITQGSAMTAEECERAILLGAELVGREKANGAQIVLLGEMGIGNTTTTAAVACALLNEEPELMTGRGAGLSDAGLKRKTDAVRRALAVNRPDPSNPMDVLAKVGGLDLAALCGACLGGAYYRIPVLLDGVITCAAALCAVRLNPLTRDTLLASHVSREPAAALLLKELQLDAPISADLHLGEGSGAVMALCLLRNVLAVYNSGHTFSHLGIDAYTPQ